MKLKKSLALLCGLALGVSIWLPGQVSAEVRTIEADGVYQMGDGMAENQSIAKERAKSEAVRSAGEQAAAYVESDTVVSNGKVTKDDIRLMTAAVLELKDVKFTPVVIGESIQFRCHVVAVVDTDKVHEKIQEDNINLKVSLKQSEEENERLRQEMEGLKQQYKTASASQRKELDKKAEENDIAYEVNSLLRQGAISGIKKDYNTSVKCFEKGIELDPDNIRGYAMLAFINYSKLGNKQKAIEYGGKGLARNLDLENEEDYFYVCYINFLMGGSYFSLHKHAEGKEYFEKVIASNSFNSWDSSLKKSYSIIKSGSYVMIGLIYALQDEYQKAIISVEKGIEIFPDDQKNEDLFIAAGAIYEESGDMKKAKMYYEKANRLKADKSKK